jgi:hypothetical protein
MLERDLVDDDGREALPDDVDAGPEGVRAKEGRVRVGLEFPDELAPREPAAPLLDEDRMIARHLLGDDLEVLVEAEPEPPKPVGDGPGIAIAPDFMFPFEVVTQSIGIVAARGSGKTYLTQVMAEEFLLAGLPFVVIDPVGVYWGLRSPGEGGEIGLDVYILGGEHGDMPLDPGAGKAVARWIVDYRHPAVLDISVMRKAEQRTFVADLAVPPGSRHAPSRPTNEHGPRHRPRRAWRRWRCGRRCLPPAAHQVKHAKAGHDDQRYSRSLGDSRPLLKRHRRKGAGGRRRAAPRPQAPKPTPLVATAAPRSAGPALSSAPWSAAGAAQAPRASLHHRIAFTRIQGFFSQCSCRSTCGHSITLAPVGYFSPRPRMNSFGRSWQASSA